MVVSGRVVSGPEGCEGTLWCLCFTSCAVAICPESQRVLCEREKGGGERE